MPDNTTESTIELTDEERTRCEVWTRVMGYHRPVAAWNPGKRSERLAIPREAVQLDNGIPTAYVLLSGESFEKRELKLGIEGEGYVEILEGVAEGERVVSQGAYAVKLAGNAPTGFAHGHVH